MNARENILRALRRQQPGWVPWGLELCDSLKEKLQAETGYESYEDYFSLPYRRLRLRPSTQTGQYDAYYRDTVLPPGTIIDQWGVARKPAGLAHLTGMIHPMADFTSPAQVAEFPKPDLLDDARWEGLARQVEDLKQRGLLAVYYSVQVFELAWYLRGLENMLMDLYDDETGMAEACLEHVCSLQEAVCRRLGQCGFDMVIFGDDVGAQQSLMMSADIWREYLKPTMRRCIKAAKAEKPDLIIYYHSDGYILPIIDELIEIGVEVLNPVQPECMDPEAVKREFGDRLSFWGTVGTQTTLPFGTPGEIREVVRRRCETVGVGGGLVLAPSHLLEPEVPLENVFAFYDAVREYGGFAPPEI